MGEWRDDILGRGFACRDLPLGEDDEGPVVATLVRSLPEPIRLRDRLRALGAPPRDRPFADLDILYVHGWSDYFFQRPLAAYFTSRGARFFALDLRKYGRSLRPGQTPGFITDLTEYDAEIGAALEIIAEGQDHSAPRPLVLLGHSTGGLVLSLWADRHRGRAAALVLNSPWLELQLSGAVRKALAPVVNLRARYNPRDLAVPQLDLGFYHEAQRQVADAEELAVVDPAWRPEHTLPIRAAWLNAILVGHARIADGIEVGAPVCALLSARSAFGLSWNDEMRRSDTVLEVDGVARAALKLGSSVTVERIDGALHDVFLSERDARTDAYARMDRWLRGWGATRA